MGQQLPEAAQNEQAIWNFKAGRHEVGNALTGLMVPVAEHGLFELLEPIGETQNAVVGIFNSLDEFLYRTSEPQSIPLLFEPLKIILAIYRLPESVLDKFYKRIRLAEQKTSETATAVRNPNFETHFNLGKLIEREITHLREAYIGPNSQVRLKNSIDIEDDTPLYHFGSPYDISKLAYNLLLNSLQATETGVVNVSVNYLIRDFSGVKLVVTNPGRIERQNLERMNRGERFTTKPSGTGSGVLDIHHAARKYGGRVKYSSIPPNGTTIPDPGLVSVNAFIPYDRPRVYPMNKAA